MKTLLLIILSLFILSVCAQTTEVQNNTPVLARRKHSRVLKFFAARVRNLQKSRRLFLKRMKLARRACFRKVKLVRRKLHKKRRMLRKKFRKYLKHRRFARSHKLKR
jgi:hypothetical protein